ncbi:hypothetical protein NM688_g8121 [Phlebia brevispora]|uniref:Uncharacterized protein n=1 Tax=Phlebia brevispora TaxID=194682 RepID=A0ACC1RX15_9APHY|nr:hypothetical protein NM688_g8121 [Phlebia brevispora]
MLRPSERLQVSNADKSLDVTLFEEERAHAMGPLRKFTIYSNEGPREEAEVKTPATDVLLKRLNTTLRASYAAGTPSLLPVLEQCLTAGYDFNMAFGRLRPFWFDDFARLLTRLASLSGKIVRRVSALWTMKGAGPRRNAWMDPTRRRSIASLVNGRELHVPISDNGTLERLRIELWKLDAEYVWLDVLWLREKNSSNLEQEEVRKASGSWTCPRFTIGYIYNQPDVTIPEALVQSCVDTAEDERVDIHRRLDSQIPAPTEGPGPQHQRQVVQVYAAFTDMTWHLYHGRSTVFAALQDASDGGVYIPHNEKCFPGFDPESKELDAEVVKKYILSGHVAEYMESLEEEDERFKKRFSTYLADSVGSEDIEEIYTTAYVTNCEDPTFKPTEKTKDWKAESLKHKAKRVTLEERKARIAVKIEAFKTMAGAATEAAEEEEDEEDELGKKPDRYTYRACSSFDIMYSGWLAMNLIQGQAAVGTAIEGGTGDANLVRTKTVRSQYTLITLEAPRAQSRTCSSVNVSDIGARPVKTSPTRAEIIGTLESRPRRGRGALGVFPIAQADEAALDTARPRFAAFAVSTSTPCFGFYSAMTFLSTVFGPRYPPRDSVPYNRMQRTDRQTLHSDTIDRRDQACLTALMVSAFNLLTT